MMGPQREILPAPCCCEKSCDVMSRPGQEKPVYRGRIFLDLCVGGFLLEPEELSALPFCDNSVGENYAGEVSKS